MESLGPVHADASLQALPQIVLPAGDGDKALCKGPVIESGASDQDAQPVPAPDILHRAEGGPPESSGREVRPGSATSIK